MCSGLVNVSGPMAAHVIELQLRLLKASIRVYVAWEVNLTDFDWRFDNTTNDFALAITPKNDTGDHVALCNQISITMHRLFDVRNGTFDVVLAAGQTRKRSIIGAVMTVTDETAEPPPSNDQSDAFRPVISGLFALVLLAFIL